MSIIGKYNENTKEYDPLAINISTDKTGKKIIVENISKYTETDEEKITRAKIIDDFRKGDTIMRKPRREFNDLSVISRMMVDQMAFNNYQPNNGEPLEGDETESWKSNALRPITRNKCISIAAHATANLIFPKVFAYNKESYTEESKAAQVMSDLMEWAGEQSDYAKVNLYAVIASLVNPASIIFTEYAESYKKVKTEKKKGKWEFEMVLDEDVSGFQDTVVPCDELYISNFYEHNIQKQDYLIWRRVISYDQAVVKYFNRDNFKYVKPGVQTIYDDANRLFYEVYDSNMRQDMVEEIIYWNKGMDCKVEMVNGIFMSEYDKPNPREDKQYPFVKFGYELLDEGKCFYYKSLAFKMMQDANIINDLYRMIIDGTYLNIMPPMIARGAETISSDVMIPGAVSTLSDPSANLEALKLNTNLGAGYNTLLKVQESVEETTRQDEKNYNTSETAYAISVKQKEATVLLGLFVQMITFFVKEFGKLRMQDILQYLTIAEAGKIEGELAYKTFLLQGKKDGATKKIKFDSSLPTEELSAEKEREMSWGILKEEGGVGSKQSLAKVNPELFRNMKYTCQVTPDLLTPMTEEAERAFNLEVYDRAIANPIANQEEVTKDFLFGTYPKSKKNPEKYIRKAEAIPTNPQDILNNQLNKNNQKLPMPLQMPVGV
jgi:hypothetical protein